MEPRFEILHEVFENARIREGAPFDPSRSPLHRRAIFLVGAPRSGTTWLHQMLAVHPDVATSGESHVFCEGVEALFSNHEDLDVKMKLSTWLPRSELVTLVRSFIDGAFESLRRSQRPDATRVLDKTPNHVPYSARLAEVYPDAAFVHITRDARDSVGSAHDLWGWDPGWGMWDVAAGRWRDSVLDCRRHLSGLRYHEVRYEDLVADPAGRLAAVFEALDLGHDDDFVHRVVEFGRAPINVRPSDSRVGARKWASLDRDAERRIIRVAGDLMIELGYLTAAERDEILSGWTLDDVRRHARALAARGAKRARRELQRRRRDRTADRRRNLRDLGGNVADLMVSGDVDRLSRLLTTGCTLEVPDAPGTPNGDSVPAVLVRLAKGASVIAVEADERASAVQLRLPGGGRQLHRYFAEGDRVGRVVVQGLATDAP